MPKNKVLTRQARKMVYDVNCYIKKETNEIVSKLKQVKKTTAETAISLNKKLSTPIQRLQLIANRTTNAVDKSVLIEICNKLEQTREEAGEASKTNENKVQQIMNNLKQEQKRTALATNTSVITVRRITTQAADSEFLTVFRTPGKKRQRAKPITDIDNFDQGVIKRCIHNFHLTNKELPTIEKLRQKLQEDLNFQGSKTSLRQIIKDLGFKWRRTENNRKVLIETTNIRLKRIEYLQKIKKYRQEGRAIIYTDESYVDSSHSNPKAWTDGSTKGLKTPISKGQRVVIVHAGSVAGFVPNALLTFKAGSKSGDYHDNMNYENYEKWLKNQLIPNIPPNSVVVVDNASYHNKQYDLAPTSNSRKADMQAWLSEKGIQFDEIMLKPQLYQLIKTHKEQYKTFSIDKILAEHNHIILRLPPYHPDLNPIEMAWAMIKQYVGSKNVKWNLNHAIELVKEKVNLMGAREWEILCNKVNSVEEEYAKSDHIIDIMTEQFVIRVTDDSSDSEESVDVDTDNSEMSDDDVAPSGSASCFQPQPSSSISYDDFMEGISTLPDD